MEGTMSRGGSETSTANDPSEQPPASPGELGGSPSRSTAAAAGGPSGGGERGRRSDLSRGGGGLVCEWEHCTELFPDVTRLAEHLQHRHIGAHKSGYSCHWSGCPRKGLAQTSRFALIAHCRSHTGEKPFVCTVTDCDKSFTRSDTLAKHLRQQHNLAAPTPTRGGYRKRKRASPSPPSASASTSVPTTSTSTSTSTAHPPQQEPPPSAAPTAAGGGRAPSHYNFANRAYAHARDAGFNTFRVNPPAQPPPPPQQHYPTAGYHHYQQHPPSSYVPEGLGREDDIISASSEEEDTAPWDTDKHGGRSKAMVKYIIMKAKHRFALEENKLLITQLEALRRQEKTEWNDKETGVDRVLRGMGPESEQLIHQRSHSRSSTPPSSSQDPPHPIHSTSTGPTNGNGTLPRRGRPPLDDPGRASASERRGGMKYEYNERDERERERRLPEPSGSGSGYVTPRRMSVDEPPPLMPPQGQRVPLSDSRDRERAAGAVTSSYEEREKERERERFTEERGRYDYEERDRDRDRERMYDRDRPLSYDGSLPPLPHAHAYPHGSVPPYHTRPPPVPPSPPYLSHSPHSPTTPYYPSRGAPAPPGPQNSPPRPFSPRSPQQHRAPAVDTNFRNGAAPPLPLQSPQAVSGGMEGGTGAGAGAGGGGWRSPGWSHERGRAPAGGPVPRAGESGSGSGSGSGER